MGEYIVNGEVIEVREDKPTAVDLKREAKSMSNDWVLASMPSGEIVKLDDNEELPPNAVEYSIVFSFGVPMQ